MSNLKINNKLLTQNVLMSFVLVILSVFNVQAASIDQLPLPKAQKSEQPKLQTARLLIKLAKKNQANINEEITVIFGQNITLPRSMKLADHQIVTFRHNLTKQQLAQAIHALESRDSIEVVEEDEMQHMFTANEGSYAK